MIDWIIDALPFLMLGSLAILLFSGLPVAVILAGLGVSFCFSLCGCCGGTSVDDGVGWDDVTQGLCQNNTKKTCV